MAIEFECPECETTIRVKDSAAGKTGRCPKCRVLLMVPDPADWEDENPEEQDEIPPAPRAPDPEPPRVETVTRDPKPINTPAIIPEDDPDTMISSAPPVLAGDQETTRPGPSPTELHASEVPIFPADTPFPAAGSLTTTDPRVAAALRGRTRRRRAATPVKTKIVFAAALVGILLLLGTGWWLYAGAGPQLTGPITGERLARARLAEVSAPLPTDDVSDDVIDVVMGGLGGEGFPLRSEYVSVAIYAGADQLDISIAPGPSAVAVRLPLGENQDVQTALKSVEKEIARAKRDELKSATIDMFVDYAAFIEDGTPIKRLPEYRDQVALNAAVGTVGYAVEAIVGSTPFPCVYEDSDGYCYFFIPEGTKSFKLKGRKILGNNNDAPLPLDFEVALIDVEEPINAGQTAAEDDGETKEDSAEETEKDSKQEEDIDEAADDKTSEDMPADEKKPEKDPKETSE